LLLSCGHPKPESPAAAYQRALATFRNGKYAEACEQAQRGARQCGADVQCRWKFRLLEAEILIQRIKDNEAGAILSQTLPSGSDFAGLDLRRRMLQGYLLTFSGDETKAAAGRELLDDAYLRAAQLGPRDLLPEMEIFEGKLFVRSGNLDKARALFLKAEQHAVEQRDRYNESAALNDLGLVTLKRSRYDEAIPFFERALDLANRVNAGETGTSAYNNLALCYTQLGDYDRALEFQKKALAWMATGDSPVLRGNLLGEMGRTLALKRDTAKAIESYQQALAIFKNLKDVSTDDTRRWTSNLATALAANGDWDAAGKANQEELALAQDDRSRAYAALNAASIAAGQNRTGDAIRLYQTAIRVKVNDPPIVWDAYDGLARAYAGAGHKPLARRYFEKGIETVDKEQTGLSRDDYKLTFLESVIRFYRDYVEFLMQSGDSDTALEVVESSRARILAEPLARRKPAGRFSAAGLRQAARRSGRVYLSYWLAPIQSYVWAISPTRIEHFALGPAAQIESLVEQSRQSMPEWDLADKESANARRLYDTVLRPVAPLMPPDARVVIVPDGALHYLNFETLPAGGVKPHYWIEDATVAVAPSLAIAAAAPPPKASRHESLLIMGDALASGKDYPKLPYAPMEMGKVGSHFGPAGKTIVTGAAATPAAYRQANPRRFSVIHFSAHGEANPQSPLDSAIILSPKDGGFKLYARDVIDVPLDADLVTLSACRSAGARVYSGEGLVGFAWAFLKAGAHYVVAGLWDVTDSSTPEMMDEFYGAMQAGQSPPDALRIAKLSMIHSAKAIRKPYYWAPFQMYIR
jgi:CHAT domain-containing protein